MRWYIDGVNVHTVAEPDTTGFSIGADVFIGKLDPLIEAQFNVDESFNGIVDEVEVFNTAVSAPDIARIYNAGPDGKCKPCLTPPADMTHWWPGQNHPNDIQGTSHGALV